MKILKEKLENNKKGITLISLVVTIVVMLILAGISIGVLIGDNGLLNQASIAKKESEKASKQEQSILSQYEDKIGQITGDGIERTAQGNYIVVNDVNPSQHNLNVNLTSQTINDFSSVSVSRYGSNLFDISQMIQANTNIVDNRDGTYTFSRTDSRFSPYCNIDIPANVPFSFGATLVEVSTLNEYTLWAELVFADGTSEYPKVGNIENSQLQVMKYDKEIVKIRFFMRDDKTVIGDYITFKEAKLNLGNISLPYEDYVKPQILTADIDGTIKEFTSLSPVITLVSNNKDVIINCKYKEKYKEYTLYGKTIVNFGDSIFGKYQAPEDISSYLADYTGATTYNVGFGGCRMSTHSDSWNAFSMYSLADSITTKNFSLQDNAISSDNSLPSYFANHLSVLKNIDFNDVDIITIAYGTNDFTGGNYIDNADNKRDISTLAGALRYSIENISKTYPDIQIVICTPMYRFWMDDNGNFLEDSDTKEINGIKLTDFVQAEKNVAKEYDLFAIDNYYDLGINKNNYKQCFPETDGTHPNSYGRKLIAEHIAQKLYERFR